MKIVDLCAYAPKSAIKAGEAIKNGKYMFFTSSNDKSKRYSDYQHNCEAIIMGTGGNATLHYYNGKFSTSTDCVVLLPNESIRCKFLYYFFLHNIAVLEKGFKGAGLKHTNKNYINNIEINTVPDIETQDKVIKALDLACNLVRFHQRQLKKLDELVKFRFIEMFVTDKNVCNWSQVRISDVSTDMRTGPFGSALHHDEFVDSGVFVLGIDNAVENRFSYNRMRYITEEKYNQLKRYTVYPGDVIITIMGTVGRSAVIPQDMPKAISTKHLACITPDSAVVDPCFLSSAFQMHPAIRLQLQNQCKGAIMDGLNLTIIKELRFQLPPIDQQKQFSEFVEQTDKSKFVIQQALDKAQLLFDSLMQKYFG